MGEARFDEVETLDLVGVWGSLPFRGSNPFGSRVAVQFSAG